MDVNKIELSLNKIPIELIFRRLQIDSEFTFADCDTLILSPIFNESLFSLAKSLTRISKNIFEVHNNNEKYIFATIDAGAGNVGDFIVQMHQIWNFKNIIFLGAAGSLCAEINEGDFICPPYAIQCDSYLEFLNSKNNILPLTRYDVKKDYYNLLCESFKSCTKNKCIHLQPVYSVNSILTHLIKMDDMISIGCNVVEMETATIFGLSIIYNINAFALLFISDNAYMGRNIYVRNRFNHLSVQKFLMKNILKIIGGSWK